MPFGNQILQKKYKNIGIVIGLFIVLASIFLIMRDDPLTISNEHWTCVWKKDICNCNLEFEITNSSPEDIIFKFSIRAQKSRPASKGSVSIEIIDRRVYEDKISHNGKYYFQETLNFKKQPTEFIVTILNNKIYHIIYWRGTGKAGVFLKAFLQQAF